MINRQSHAFSGNDYTPTGFNCTGYAHAHAVARAIIPKPHSKRLLVLDCHAKYEYKKTIEEQATANYLAYVSTSYSGLPQG